MLKGIEKSDRSCLRHPKSLQPVFCADISHLYGEPAKSPFIGQTEYGRLALGVVFINCSMVSDEELIKVLFSYYKGPVLVENTVVLTGQINSSKYFRIYIFFFSS